MLKRSMAVLAGLVVVAGILGGCQITPRFDTYYQYGAWLQEQGKCEQAIEAFERYREERPDSVLIPMMLLRKGECYEALGQYDMAMDSYEEAANMSPNEVGPFAKEKLDALKAKMSQM